jgi:NADH-quinone oxidoreductase subunit M
MNPTNLTNIDASILSLLVFAPLAGALLILLLPSRGKLLHYATLAISLILFLFTLHLPAHYTYGTTGFQFEVNLPWITNPAIRYHLGVDGLSMWLVVLTGLLAPLGVIASWRVPAERAKLFFSLFLVQQTAIFGVFVTLDLFLYYGFWELSLIPMALLISSYGRTSNAPRAAIRFFLYAFIPSALLLVAIIWLYAVAGSFDYTTLHQLAVTHGITATPCALLIASLAFLFAFAVKVPIFPLHGWLADAIDEGPTAVVMVLAGKLGLYSLLRFSLGIFPDQSRAVAPVVIALAVISILYGALLALAQTNFRRLAAYSIVSHLGFVVLGIYSFSLLGTSGAIFQVLSHSVSDAAFFILLGLLYERYSTNEISSYGGLATRVPWFTTLFVITALSLIGLPMLNGFVGEFLILAGSFTAHPAWTSVAALGVILGAVYILRLVQKIFYGELNLSLPAAPDLNLREQLALWPVAVLMLAMGLASPFWMNAINEFTIAAATHITNIGLVITGGIR